jgi:glycosyltransferase involved in cell wall biosynthesis
VRDYLDDESAILLRSRKIDIVVAAIMDILNDGSKRRELGYKARERMLSYDWKVIAAAMEKAYKVY